MDFSREKLIEPKCYSVLPEHCFFLSKRENLPSVLVMKELLKLYREVAIELTCNKREKEVLFLRKMGYTHERVGEILGTSGACSRVVSHKAEKKILKFVSSAPKTDWSFLKLLDKEEEETK